MDIFINTFLPLFIAPFIGSFMGVLIARLPEGRPIVWARSICERCGERLGPRDLIPLLSYTLTVGRCRHCRTPIGLFPLAVELAALGVAVWAVLVVSDAEIWWTCAFGWALLTLTWIDVRAMILPDVLTLPLALGGLIATAALEPNALSDHVMAAVLGYGGLAGFAWIYRQLRHRDGLGGGDAKLLGAIGAWSGLASLPLTVFLAACIGLMIAGGTALAGRRMTATTALPFGPCLALAAWLFRLHGARLTEWVAGL